MRTREQKAMWLRVSGAMALIGYLILLFYAHVHVAHEAHEHGEAAHASHHAEEPGHDHDHEEAPHPAADHSLTASVVTTGKVNQLFVWHFVRVSELVFAPVEETDSGFGWIEDRPKHPPPRLPEQPRSPPIA